MISGVVAVVGTLPPQVAPAWEAEFHNATTTASPGCPPKPETATVESDQYRYVSPDASPVYPHSACWAWSSIAKLATSPVKASGTVALPNPLPFRMSV